MACEFYRTGGGKIRNPWTMVGALPTPHPAGSTVLYESTYCSRFSTKRMYLHVLVSAHEKETETNYWQKGS